MPTKTEVRLKNGETFASGDSIFSHQKFKPTHETPQGASIAQAELTNGTKEWIYTASYNGKSYQRVTWRLFNKNQIRSIKK